LNHKITEQIIASLILTIPFVYLLLLQVLGANAFYMIHDNMDSGIVFRLVLKNAGILFSTSNDTIVPSVMLDLPRNAFIASAHNVTSWLFAWLQPLQAYQANEALVRIIGLLGTYLLCSQVLIPASTPYRCLLSAFLATCFAMTQVYAIYGLIVFGVPLILFLGYRALMLKTPKAVLGAGSAVVVYGFYSSLALFGFALIICCFLIAAILWLRRMQKEAYILAGLVVLLGCVYLYSEKNLINLFLFGDQFVSHRSEFNVMASMFVRSTDSVWDTFTRTLFFGHYHSLYAPLIPIVASALAFFLVWREKAAFNKPLALALTVAVLLACIQAMSYSYSYAVIRVHVKILQMFAWERFFFAFPIVWTIVLALAIVAIVRSATKPLRWLLPLLVAHLGLILMSNTEFRANVTQVAMGGWPAQQIFRPILIDESRSFSKLFGSRPIATWEQFHAQEIFQQIHNEHPEIKKNGRVGCLGFYPAIAQFNGYSTVDSYQNNYALSYKARFRKIIEGELDRSPSLREYFDAWGGRCYLVSRQLTNLNAPLRGLYVPNPDIKIKDFRFSNTAFSAVGGTHLLSSAEILNAEAIGLTLIGKYEAPSTPLRVFVYRGQQ